MPEHRVYIETHLGSGAVLLNKRPAVRSYGIEVDPAVLARWHGRKVARLHLVQDDAVRFLTDYSFEGHELVYSDPPYLPATRRRSRVYRYDYDEADHCRLLKVLRHLPCSVMLSGYPNELYDKLLAGWRQVEFITPTQRGRRTEKVWMNFAPPRLLHDHSHLGDNFREREQIRRRRQRLLGRIQRLDAAERNALLAEIVARNTVALSRLLNIGSPALSSFSAGEQHHEAPAARESGSCPTSTGLTQPMKPMTTRHEHGLNGCADDD